MQFDKVLIIDDELVIRKSLEEQLRCNRYTVASVSTLSAAENLLAKDNFDLVFLDVRLPDGDGKQRQPLHRLHHLDRPRLHDDGHLRRRTRRHRPRLRGREREAGGLPPPRAHVPAAGSQERRA